MASPQTSAAHFYLVSLRGDPEENLGGKFIPLVTLRDTVLLYLCALNGKAKGQQRMWHLKVLTSEGIYIKLY